MLCKSERLRLNPFEYLVQLASGGADRKDEFFRFNVSPFFTQSRGIKATFLHGALIYFSPLHNAALAVKCMNKERDSPPLSRSLSLSLSLSCSAERLGLYLRSWTHMAETINLKNVRRGFILELRIAQISSIFTSKKRMENLFLMLAT